VLGKFSLENGRDCNLSVLDVICLEIKDKSVMSQKVYEQL